MEKDGVSGSRRRDYAADKSRRVSFRKQVYEQGFVKDGMDYIRDHIDDTNQMNMFILLQKTSARCKLEKISRVRLLMVLVLYLIVILTSFTSAVIYVVLSSLASEPSLTIKISNVAIVLQCLIHLAANIICVFLLIAFPQRILVRAFKEGVQPLPEQVIIVILILFMNVTPQFTFASAVCMFQVLVVSAKDAKENLDPEDTGQFFLEYFSGICEELVDLDYNRFMVITCLAAFFLSIGTMITLQSIPHVDHAITSDSPHEEPEEKQGTDEDNVSRKGEHRESDVEGELGGIIQNDDDEKENQPLLSNTILTKGYNCCEHFGSFFCKYCCCCCSNTAGRKLSLMFKSAASGLDYRLTILVVVFYIYHVSAIFRLDYAPSFVPLVDAITVFRVCADDGEEVRDLNATGFYYPFCAAGSTGYYRAIVICVGVVITIAIFITMGTIKRRARKEIKKLQYSKNRSTHLLFNFFGVFTSIGGWMGFLVSLIIVFGPSAAIWIVEVRSIDNKLVEVVDPLHNVGISGAFQVPNIFLIFASWMLVISYAYLPPDSYGFKGWFCGSKQDEQERRDRIREDDREHPIYLSRESEFSNLENIRENLSHTDTMLNTHTQLFSNVNKSERNLVLNRINSNVISVNSRRSQDTDLLESEGNTDSSYSDTSFLSQVKSNVFVMETEILLFNFSCTAYWVNKDKSFEENAKLVEDDNFKLVDVITDEKTDTQCIIAVSLDRIVLSFRGTVSGVNVKTDFDYSLVKVPWLKDAKDVSVHGGFLRAYTTVKDRICDILDSLIKEQPDRVVLCTGHSLGGGLAVLASFHLSISLKPAAIGCSTWGCPKVGSYRFSLIYNDRVPCARRFVNARDLIPQLPWQSPWTKIRKTGYFHVGLEVAMNKDGTLIIGPNSLEKKLIAGFRRPIKANHFNSRYSLALLTWCTLMHWDEWAPKFWSGVINGLLRYCDHIIEKNNEDLRGKLRYQLHQHGIVYKGKHKTLLRDIGIQVDADAILAEEQEEYADMDTIHSSEYMSNTASTLASEGAKEKNGTFYTACPSSLDDGSTISSSDIDYNLTLI